MCRLLPQAALAQATGRRTFIQDREPEGTASGFCGLEPAPPEAEVVSIDWGWADAEDVMHSVGGKALRRGSQRPIPAELGKGFTGVTTVIRTEPWTSVVKFACGKRQPYILLQVTLPVKGRDHREDLITLTKFAQERYGELNKCTPKPLSKRDSDGDG